MTNKQRSFAPRLETIYSCNTTEGVTLKSPRDCRQQPFKDGNLDGSHDLAEFEGLEDPVSRGC